MRVLLAGTFVLVSCTMASAGWQGTTWGMSESEVLRAVPGAVQTDGSMTVDFTVFGLGQQRQIAVTARLHFHSGSLTSVEVNPDFPQTDCSVLPSMMEGIYGPAAPRDFPQGTVSHWRDTASGNLIRLFANDDSTRCTVVYEALPEPNQPGGL